MNLYRYTIKLPSGAHMEFDTQQPNFPTAYGRAFDRAHEQRGEIIEIRRMFRPGEKHAPLPLTLKERIQAPIGGSES